MTTTLNIKEVRKLVEVIEQNPNSAHALGARETLIKWRDEHGLVMDDETRILIEATIGTHAR